MDIGITPRVVPVYRDKYILDKNKLENKYNLCVEQLESSNIIDNVTIMQILQDNDRSTIVLGYDMKINKCMIYKHIAKRYMSNISKFRKIREIYILSIIKHKNIIKLDRIIETPREIIMVMPYYEDGDLYKSVINKSLDDTQIYYIMFKLLKTVKYLHYFGICHRDIKCENILLNKNEPILCDYDYATVIDMKNNSSVGTMMYAAPELLLGKSYYGTEVDVYSLGVLFYILLFGKAPFGSNKDEILRECHMGLDLYTKHHISIDMYLLLCKMLNFDKNKRWTISKCLQSHVFNKYRKCEIETTINHHVHTCKYISELSAWCSNEFQNSKVY